MFRRWIIGSLLFSLCRPAGWSQETLIPIVLGQPGMMIAPTLDGPGQAVVFGSAVTPEGAFLPAVDLYTVGSQGAGLRRLTRLAGGSQPLQGALAVSLTPDGRWAAFSTLGAAGRGEEVHLLDVARGADRMIVEDNKGCIQPLALDCPICFFACVQTPHLTPDGSAVLYAVRRSQPFHVARGIGSVPRNLPIYQGALAPSPQRVISRSGQFVFVSSAPYGPTFAPTAGDIYLANLDGLDIRQVTRFGDAAVYAREATISPDGSRIAFLANLDAASGRATNTTQLFTIRADGTGLRAIPAGERTPSSPSLSGDGDRLAFVAGGDVFTAASDGSSVQQRTRFRFSAAGNSVFSDDGSRLAFTLGPTTGGFRDRGIGAIYVMNADGSGLVAAYAPRALNPGGITDAALGYGAPVAGSLISAFGINFDRDTFAQAGSLPLPEALSDISLTLNGIPVPMLSVGPWQLNAQIPPEQIAGPAAFEVRSQDGARTAPIAHMIQNIGAAIYPVPSVDGYARGAVVHAGSGLLVDPAHPARPGEVLEIYASGLGPTNPFVAAGVAAPANPPARTIVRPEVQIGRRSARVLFSGLAPGFVGLYQVNAEVPPDTPPGDAVSLSLTIGGVGSDVTIAVR